MKSISKVLRIGAGVVALLLALGIFFVLKETKPEADRTDGRRPPISVNVMVAESRDVPRVWSGYGTARAMDASNLAAEVDGRIVERPETIEAGVQVGQGELIVLVDPTNYEQALAAAQRNAEALRYELSGLEVEEQRLSEQIELSEEEVRVEERDLQRAEDAFERGAGSRSEVDRFRQVLQSQKRALTTLRQQFELIPSRRAALQARLLGAEADARLAEENVTRTQIRAPYAGTLQAVDVEEGEFIGRGQRVARVVDLARMEIPVRLPVTAGDSVRPGDRVLLRPDGNDNDTIWQGSVVRVAPEADRDSRTLTVFAEVRQDPRADRAQLLRPGRFVTAQVFAADRSARVLVPRRVVDVDRVLVAREVDDDDPALDRFDLTSSGRVRRIVEVQVNVDRALEGSFPEIDPIEDQWAALEQAGVDPTAALQPGDLVVLSNLDSLRPGSIIDARLLGEDAQASRNGPQGDTP
ncbi:MAG: HlyD family efflux transporter periplasmic adaptor subunit [Planctomycetota bacterium]